AFMDQDEEHDADPEGPPEELRVNQRRDASRYHGKPQTLELQNQQTDVRQLAQDQPENGEDSSRDTAVGPTAIGGVRGNIGLHRSSGAVAVIGRVLGIAVLRIDVSHYLEDAQAGCLSIAGQGRVKLPRWRSGQRSARCRTNFRIPIPRVGCGIRSSSQWGSTLRLR